jgi:predicted RNase H-like HicB family nuclease
MTPESYKTVFYRLDRSSWIADIPAVPGCYRPMPTRDAAVAELAKVFAMIAKQYRLKGQALPADSTEIINA